MDNQNQDDQGVLRTLHGDIQKTQGQPPNTPENTAPPTMSGPSMVAPSPNQSMGPPPPSMTPQNKPVPPMSAPAPAPTRPPITQPSPIAVPKPLTDNKPMPPSPSVAPTPKMLNDNRPMQPASGIAPTPKPLSASQPIPHTPSTATTPRPPVTSQPVPPAPSVAPKTDSLSIKPPVAPIAPKPPAMPATPPRPMPALEQRPPSIPGSVAMSVPPPQSSPMMQPATPLTAPTPPPMQPQAPSVGQAPKPLPAQPAPIPPPQNAQGPNPMTPQPQQTPIPQPTTPQANPAPAQPAAPVAPSQPLPGQTPMPQNPAQPPSPATDPTGTMPEQATPDEILGLDGADDMPEEGVGGTDGNNNNAAQPPQEEKEPKNGSKNILLIIVIGLIILLAIAASAVYFLNSSEDNDVPSLPQPVTSDPQTGETPNGEGDINAISPVINNAPSPIINHPSIQDDSFVITITDESDIGRSKQEISSTLRSFQNSGLPSGSVIYLPIYITSRSQELGRASYVTADLLFNLLEIDTPESLLQSIDSRKVMLYIYIPTDTEHSEEFIMCEGSPPGVTSTCPSIRVGIVLEENPNQPGQLTQLMSDWTENSNIDLSTFQPIILDPVNFPDNPQVQNLSLDKNGQQYPYLSIPLHQDATTLSFAVADQFLIIGTSKSSVKTMLDQINVSDNFNRVEENDPIYDAPVNEDLIYDAPVEVPTEGPVEIPTEDEEEIGEGEDVFEEG